MAFLRSLLFSLAVIVVTVPYALFACLIFFLPPWQRHRLITFWARIMLWLIRHVLGIRYTVIGCEHIPRGPAVILSKHQSAWETLALQEIFPPMCFVLKRELLWIPFLGWGLAQVPGIAIDRSAGKDALTQVLEQGVRRLSEGFWVAVFPEGTRVAPGVSRRYKPGGAVLAVQAGVPVVPVAHNAGDFWRRNAFLKRAGLITVSVGPAIVPDGLSADEVSARAEEWIEAEMRRLFAHQYIGQGSRDMAS
jgi:1-acyl-sn-glycerol-3-phosphate acyltransferase